MKARGFSSPWRSPLANLWVVLEKGWPAGLLCPEYPKPKGWQFPA